MHEAMDVWFDIWIEKEARRAARLNGGKENLPETEDDK
jgi:hypothetical protein